MRIHLGLTLKSKPIRIAAMDTGKSTLSRILKREVKMSLDVQLVPLFKMKCRQLKEEPRISEFKTAL
jgi:hypothetical protein